MNDTFIGSEAGAYVISAGISGLRVRATHLFERARSGQHSSLLRVMYTHRAWHALRVDLTGGKIRGDPPPR